MKIAFLIPAVLLLADGGSDDFTCSSKPVLETVIDIARKQLTKKLYVFDGKNLGFDIEDIRTQGRNDRAITCAANMTPTGLQPIPEIRNDPPGKPWTQEQVSKMLAGAGIETSAVTYKVEKLDKGGYYVTLRGW